MENWPKMAHFSPKRGQKAPRDPLGSLRIIIIFSSCQDIWKPHARKKNFIVTSRWKKVTLSISRSGSHFGFLSKKGGHIVVEIERYSKSFLNMIIYTCAKRHTFITKTAYGFPLPSHYNTDLSFLKYCWSSLKTQMFSTMVVILLKIWLLITKSRIVNKKLEPNQIS